MSEKKEKILSKSQPRAKVWSRAAAAAGNQARGVGAKLAGTPKNISPAPKPGAGPPPEEPPAAGGPPEGDLPEGGRADKKLRPAGRRPLSSRVDTKETICRETILVMSDRGLAGTTIKEIARRAGVTPAMIHYFFDDKESLFQHTLDRYLRPFSDTVWEIVDLDLGPLEMIREFFYRLQNIALDNAWYLPFWGREMLNLEGSLREYMRSLVDPRKLAVFRDKIAEGQRQGILNPDLIPEMVFFTILTASFMPRLFRPEWAGIFGVEITEEMVSRHNFAAIFSGLAGQAK